MCGREDSWGSPRGRWTPAERLRELPSEGAAALLSLGYSSEMLSQGPGCQILQTRLTFVILEGAGAISISLAPGLRPRGLPPQGPQTPAGAGEGAVTSGEVQVGTVLSLWVLPGWLAGEVWGLGSFPFITGAPLSSSRDHRWGLHHPSPPPAPSCHWADIRHRLLSAR